MTTAITLTTVLCPIHAVTGYWCPGCGLTRAMQLVATGHPVSALARNPLWPLVLGLAGWALASWRFPRARLPVGVWVTVGVLAVAFGVARNVPAMSALAP